MQVLPYMYMVFFCWRCNLMGADVLSNSNKCWWALQAMVGFVWALVAEKMTGLTVMEQLFNPGTSGALWFGAVVQLFTLASIIPFVNGESTDARRWGPFTARAERWNGRLAMIGFATLLVDEMIRQGPLIH